MGDTKSSFMSFNFSEDQLNEIKKISPVLRMLRGEQKEVSIVYSFPVTKKREDDDALFIDATTDIPVHYKQFVATKKSEPKFVFYKESIGFALGETIEEALFYYTAYCKGEKASAVAYKKEESPKWKPSLFRKVCLVTGGAQGLGGGISEYLLSQGAYVIIADVNEEGAIAKAVQMAEEHGVGSVAAVKINVADEVSVQEALMRALSFYGGIDILISNAGVLRSGPLNEISFADFKFVTEVNYYGYFLLVKHVSQIMKMQHEINSTYWMDIIQINSKSGLVGSNKNSAYAGSKFGGIGLTQSFALELVSYKIKVNAICPGNNLDGPLWTDPQKGLFLQYLQAGKVPGAKTIEDVKESYMAKVPMHRGCFAQDLGLAISYIVAQEYETGQAIPVTGGQQMLN